MTNDNHKSNCCGGVLHVVSDDHEGTSYYRCDVCLQPCDPKPLPSECPVCLTVQTGAHTCKRAKPLPSDPECKRLRESGNDLGSVYVPEPSCDTMEKINSAMEMFGRTNGKYVKKLIEPSVEEIAENVINEIITTAYKQTGYYKMADIAKPIIAEALRNERNRHG